MQQEFAWKHKVSERNWKSSFVGNTQQPCSSEFAPLHQSLLMAFVAQSSPDCLAWELSSFWSVTLSEPPILRCELLPRVFFSFIPRWRRWMFCLWTALLVLASATSQMTNFWWRLMVSSLKISCSSSLNSLASFLNTWFPHPLMYFLLW